MRHVPLPLASLALARSGVATEPLERGGALIVPLLSRDPERVAVLHDVGQHGAAQEHHVLAPRRVLDAALEGLCNECSRRK